MIIWVWRYFLYSSSVYSCHLFLISSASVRSIPFSTYSYYHHIAIDHITDGQYWNQIDYILCSQKWRTSIQSAKTRPFRYDLNQIPYDYTVEVTNRFKGLDLIDRVPDELWTEVCDIVQETGIKTIPKKKKCKKAKWLSEEALQIAVKEEKWKAKEKRKDISIWMQSSKE